MGVVPFRPIGGAPVLLLGLLGVAAVAGAQPPEQPPPADSASPDAPAKPAASSQPIAAPDAAALAQVLFEEGLALARDKRFDAACPKFEESLRLEAKTGTAYNLARCYEVSGRVASAWATYQEAARLARADKDAARAEKAREAHEALAPRLARLTVVVPEAHRLVGLEVVRDGLVLAPSAWDVAVPVDPGDHVIVARAPGRRPWRQAVTIGEERVNESVTVPLLEVEPPPSSPPPQAPPSAATAPVRPPPAPVAPPPVSPPPEPSTVGPTLMWTGFAVGAAGTLVGTITGAVVLARAGQLEDGCTDDWCHPDLESDLDTTVALAHVSNIGFVVGAVGLGLGLVAWVTSDGDAGAERAVRAIHLTAGLGSAQVVIPF